MKLRGVCMEELDSESLVVVITVIKPAPEGMDFHMNDGRLLRGRCLCLEKDL